MSLQITPAYRHMADQQAGGWDAPEAVCANPPAREPRTIPQTTHRTRPDHRSGFWVAPELPQSARNKRGVDIIAIHGVGAHAIDTWTHRAKDVNWLTDPRMLRLDVPNSRVMIYGYESQWMGSESLTTTVNHIAESFVERLITQRNETGQRPMIFVAHCFGGIVLIKAMLILKSRGYLKVLKSVAGLLFFGTPFRGVNGAMSDGQLVERARQQGQDVRPEILNVLKEDDGHLRDILQQFIDLSREGRWSPTICCYTESKPAGVWRIVDDRGAPKEIIVKETSAFLDIAHVRHPLPHDHFNMNKILDHDDQAYKDIVKNHILGIAQRCRKWKFPWPSPSRAGASAPPQLHRPAQTSEPEITPINGSPPPSVARPPSSARQPSVFSPHDERPIAFFQVDRHVRKFDLKCKDAGIKTAFACGLSSDAKRVFILDQNRLVFYSINAIMNRDLQHSSKLAPEGWNFRSVKMTATYMVAIYTKASTNDRKCCWRLYRISSPPEASLMSFTDVSVLGVSQETSTNSQYKCVAMHESSDFLLVALAEIDVMETGRTSPLTQIHLIKVFPKSAYESPQHQTLSLNVLHDDNDIFDDSTPAAIHGHAKFLTFSPDGFFLLCCTHVQKKSADSITVWKITHGLSHFGVEFVCDKIHRYIEESSVKAITSAACWISDKGNPYMFVTTSPSSQRKLNHGEWSFITPISRPLPTYQDDAMHCLYQAQHEDYMSMMSSAVAPAGNAVAFVSQCGEICVVPLEPIDKGGIRASDGSVTEPGKRLTELNKTLRSLQTPDEAALRFSDDGTRLIAVDTLGTLLIATCGRASGRPILS